MKLAIITVGISASGKTTYVKKMVEDLNDQTTTWINVNRDDIRFGIIGTEDWSKWSFTKENESAVNVIQQQMISDAIENGHNLVISDTNINDQIRNNSIIDLVTAGYYVDLVWFDIDLGVALKRNALRTNPVKPSVIESQYQRYIKLVERVESSKIKRRIIYQVI